ncbi:hypothetical protein BDZ89DRAFT_1135501 [Hymenopellis radicata]|nr:hypothetical protein BDZ89DRAFT_1135501 [Hymenopellis radicata]
MATQQALFIESKQGPFVLGTREIRTPLKDEVLTRLHGTRYVRHHFPSSQGISKMNRNHIHLPHHIHLPQGHISGMRKTASVFIYIDVQKALDAGIKFSLSDNGVVLTEGNTDGFLPTTYFSKVASVADARNERKLSVR